MENKGTVAAESMQPYLVAINKILLGHGKPPVAVNPMVTGGRKGFAICQRDLVPTPERLPLPTPVALIIMERVEELLKGTQWAAHGYTDNTLMRACIATISSYVFFYRGEYGACKRR